MQTHSIFQPEEIVKQSIKQPTLSVLIDPEIFFVFKDDHYIIHPIIRTWLDKMRENLNVIHYYFLTPPGRIVPHVTIINTINHQFQLPINEVYKLLTDESHQYLMTLFENGQEEFAKISQKPDEEYCIDGIAIGGYTGEHLPHNDEMLVITANPKFAEIFKKKGITVAKLDTDAYYEPLFSSDDMLPTKGLKCEIYSDFDGTLFNVDGCVALEIIRNTIGEDKDLEDLLNNDNLKLIHEKTIACLSKFKDHPTILITQRCNDHDNPSYSNSKKIVKHINEQYGLCIQADDASFLFATKEVERKKSFSPKIKKILERMESREEHDRPTYILLIDDSLWEIAECENREIQLAFAKLGIEVNKALIMHPAHYLTKSLNCLKENNPSLFKKVENLQSQEVEKLNAAFECVVKKQSPGAKVVETNLEILEKPPGTNTDNAWGRTCSIF